MTSLISLELLTSCGSCDVRLLPLLGGTAGHADLVVWQLDRRTQLLLLLLLFLLLQGIELLALNGGSNEGGRQAGRLQANADGRPAAAVCGLDFLVLDGLGAALAVPADAAGSTDVRHGVENVVDLVPYGTQLLADVLRDAGLDALAADYLSIDEDSQLKDPGNLQGCSQVGAVKEGDEISILVFVLERHVVRG